MKKSKFILIALILTFIIPQTANSRGVTALNAENLIGKWTIYDENNTTLLNIEIILAITQAGVSNFTYKILGNDSSQDDALQGLMVNQNQLIIESFNVGQSNTFVFDINFEENGGPGKLLKTVFADCSEVGVDTDLVKKKNQKRLASSSQLCNKRNTELSTLANVKIAKEGILASSISSSSTIPAEFSGAVANLSGQIESAWALKNNKKNSHRFLVKDLSANFLGYEFTYRIINKKQKLKKLTEDGFKSSERKGLLLDEYLVINTTSFNEENAINIIDLNNKKRSGKGYFILTPNGDCFVGRTASANSRICTPNYDTSLANSISKRSSKARLRKINTKTKISF